MQAGGDKPPSHGCTHSTFPLHTSASAALGEQIESPFDVWCLATTGINDYTVAKSELLPGRDCQTPIARLVIE